MIISSKIEAKSFGDGSQDICKHNESNLPYELHSAATVHFLGCTTFKGR